MDIKGIYFRDLEQSHITEMLYEMYKERVYAPFIEDKNNSVILDIGANVGVFSIYAYPFASKIYAMEPSSDHYEVLEKMITNNEMDKKITTIKKALSLKDGIAPFYHNGNPTANSLNSLTNSEKGKEESVETIRLDTFLTQNGIEHVDFMKLDVEGEECNIIEGEGFSLVKDKIASLIVEYHTWSGRNPSQMVSALNDLGFDVAPIPSNSIIFGARHR